MTKHLFLAATLSLLTASNTFAGPLLFDGDFDTGDKSQYEYLEACCSHSSNVSAARSREGRYAHKIVLKKQDPNRGGSKRVEFTLKRNNESGGLGDERWIGFSIYIPANWIDDNPGAGELVWQIHSTADACDSPGQNPPLGLYIEEGNWVFLNRYNSEFCTLKSEQSTIPFEIGALRKGSWNDFVIHTKLSYQNDGYTQVWLNGDLAMDYTGANYFNDAMPGYMKFGLYKWSWSGASGNSKVNTRVLFHDQLRVGDETSNYSDVAPVSKNLVLNAGFENSFNDWVSWGNSASVKNNAVSGIRSLRISGVQGGVAQFIDLDEQQLGQRFRLEATAKTARDGEVFWVGIHTLSNGAQIGPEHVLSFDKASYASSDKIFSVPRNADQIMTYVWKENSTGSVHVDDIGIVKY